MLTRRQFLARTAGLMVAGGIVDELAGCAGHTDAAARPAPSATSQPGPAATNQPGAHPLVAGPTTGTLDSQFMRRPVGWTIAPGPGGRTAGLVVCLHGKGENHRMAFDLGLPETARSLSLPLGIAAVDGGPDSYWHKRADGTDALAMLLQEFVPMIERRFPGVPKAIMGWSMGGYGALLTAEQSPDQWRAVAATSPALWTSPGGTAPGAFDGSADYHSYDIWTGLDGLGRMVVRLDCGTSDPFYSATRKLDAKLPFPHQAVFGPGHHDHAYWRRVAPAQLQSIAVAFGAA